MTTKRNSSKRGITKPSSRKISNTNIAKKKDNKVDSKVVSKNKNFRKKGTPISVSFSRFFMKSVRNILILGGLILFCYSALFELRVLNSSSNLLIQGKELVLIEKWPLNNIYPLKLENNSTVMLNDSSVGFILASWEDTVFIEDNLLILNGEIKGALPTDFVDNQAYFLADNEYLLLLNNKVVVVDSLMIKGELSGTYNISKFNQFF